MNERMMVPIGPDLLINSHATTKMHLEIKNAGRLGVNAFFYEFLRVLPSQIYKHLRLELETWMLFLFFNLMDYIHLKSDKAETS